MVRTVRSVEEEARVRRIAGVGWDTYLRDKELREALDGRFIEDLKKWATEGARRVLVVGLEDQGDLAVFLASSGLFVTVVDPDEKLIEQARQQADLQKCALRMNFYASDYMKKDFASSGFDLVVFLACLSRYNEPLTVVRKATRELRAGGRFFARLRIRPSINILHNVERRFPLFLKLGQRVSSFASRIGALERLISLPEAAQFLSEMGSILKIEKVERAHLVSPALAALASESVNRHLKLILSRSALALSRAEAALFSKVTSLSSIASYLVVFATKELGLGKTFHVGGPTMTSPSPQSFSQ